MSTNGYHFLTIDIIKNYSEIIYKTSAQTCGSDAARIVPERPVLHGYSSRFSGHLGRAGMVINNGLNTHVERERVIDYSQDWQDTNIWSKSNSIERTMVDKEGTPAGMYRV